MNSILQACFAVLPRCIDYEPFSDRIGHPDFFTVWTALVESIVMETISTSVLPSFIASLAKFSIENTVASVERNTTYKMWMSILYTARRC